MTDTAPVIRPAEIAAYLAARMCHDFISPASAIASGLDLLEDPSAQDMREEAMGLIVSSSKKLADLLSYCRVAFGASSSAETFDARDLEKLARGAFAHMRAELEWTVDTPAVNKPAARTLLNLAQMAGAALPTGGTARCARCRRRARSPSPSRRRAPARGCGRRCSRACAARRWARACTATGCRPTTSTCSCTTPAGACSPTCQDERVVFAATLPA